MEKQQITEAGFYEMSDEDYHADPCPAPSLSSTMANEILESTEVEAMMSSKRLNPDHIEKKSKEMDFGTMAHDFILKGEEGTYEVAKFDAWRSDEAKAAKADIESRGLIALNETTAPRFVDDIKEMKKRLFEQLADHQEYSGILKKGRAELCGFVKDGELWLRAKFDFLEDEYIDPSGRYEQLIVDYKTTGLAFPQWEKNQLWDGKYMQSPHYRKVAELITKKKTKFIFLVQQIKKPFLIKIFELDDGYTDLIDARYASASFRFANCLKTGEWRGEPPYTAHSYPPPWVMQKWEMDALDDAVKDEQKNKIDAGDALAAG